MKRVWHVTNEERRNTYKVLVRNPEGKRPHERLMHKWKKYIKTNLSKL